MKKEAKIKQKLANQEINFGFFGLVDNLLSDLPRRSQEIIKKRFGMAGKDRQTLDNIGKEYKITRERVRQIIVDSIKKISKKRDDENFKKAEEKIFFTIDKNNGIMEKEEILKFLGGSNWKEASAVEFIVFSSEKIKSIEDKGLIKESLAISAEIAEKVKKIDSLARDIFKKIKKTLTDEEIIKELLSLSRDFSREQVLSYIKVLSGIMRNKFGKWGMADWNEISPKGTRERIYLVLKEKREPLHFTEIARIIDEYGLAKRKSHPQTVHNELIKDERFVLIGRGIYALKEWGYEQGTVKDVLENILKRSGKFLNKDSILNEILKVRKVKKSTVMINLNNSNYFVKQNGAYSVREKVQK